MNDNVKNACKEYQNMSRRKFLSGAAGVAGAISLPFWAPRMAFAQSGPARDVLIVIYLRGGADGLTFCVPHGDARYYQLRPTIAVPQPSSGAARKAIDLNGYFGLPPAFQNLKQIFDAQHLGIIHAVGRNNWTRSHFEAQKFMEYEGDILGGSGWLSRHLGTTAPVNPNGSFRGIAFSDSVPGALSKAQQVVVTRNPADYRFSTRFPDQAEVDQTIGRMYARITDDSRTYVRDAQRAVQTFSQTNFGSYATAGGYPYGTTDLGNSLKYTAALMKAEVGLELAHIDFFGWDTHASQGSVDGGMDASMQDLANNMCAFYQDLAGTNIKYTLVVMSEFGRQVAENGSLGTDHGSGGCMLTMGPGVMGGQVKGTWPGLQQANLFEGVDLKPTTDYRAVLGELLVKRLQNSNVQTVMPGAPAPATTFFKAA